MKIWYRGAFPIVLLVQLGVFSVFGLYRGVWRATGIGDLLRVLFAVVTAVALSYTVVLLTVPPSGVIPFFCINLLVLATLTSGARCTYRVLDYTNQRENSVGSGALIYGAGRGGQLVLRELLQNAELGLRPIGFLDDDPSLRQRTVNRVPVLGASSDLSLILESQLVASVVIASDKISGDRLQNVLCLCEERHIPVLHAHLKLVPIATNGNGVNGS